MAVGTDVVEVERLRARLAKTPALATRLFTPRERELCPSHLPQSLAARLAAKEAVLKALGSALTATPPALTPEPPAWRLTDIEVPAPPGTPPVLALHGPTARLADALGIRRWHLSLAHDGGLALAFVVAEGLA